MSDNELSDGMEELQDILREYAEKEKGTTKNAHEETEKEDDNTDSTKDNEAAASTSGPKTQATEWIKSAEEIRMEKLVFGDKEGLLENLKKASKSKKSDDEDQSERAAKRKPVWHDEDDDELQVGEVKHRNKRTGPLTHLQKDKPYKDYLKSRFQRVISTPKWADLDRQEEPDSDEEILRTVGFINSSKSATLPPNDIEVKRLKDLNRATYAEGTVNGIQFHPTSTAAMVSGLNGIATLYAIDGLKNEKLHSIRFHNFPIKCARILHSGTQAMFTSKFKHFFSYDLMKATETRHIMPAQMSRISNFEISPCDKYFAANGHFGELHFFDLKSKEFIRTLKQEEPCRAVLFSLDSTKIFVSSRGSTINIYDIRQQRIMHSFIDDGCIKGKSLALSPDGKMLATGSAEGAVNIYDYEKIFTSKAPQPEKTILNLTTAINQLRFNHTSEILGMCSDMIPSAVKLVHFPTGTVFANFPGFKADLKCIRTLEFSPSSGFLALGNTTMEAPLFRLKHFNNY